ncbi:unnamed protein product, partial [Phaeothamnion confervicola]
EELVDAFQCTICHDLMAGATLVLDCLHSFCGHCLETWLTACDECPGGRRCCPMCREPARAHAPHPFVDGLIERAV